VALPRNHLKNTARGIVVHDGRILLMERWRDNLHYFSIPGGGIEPGETPQQTVEREITEETSVRVKVQEQVLEMHDGDFSHKIYLCEYVGGEAYLRPNAPEAFYGPTNRFQPRWVQVSQLPELPFIYWQPIKQHLIDGLANGFKGAIKIVSASSSR
jgi:8-oxo-dGTP pyrophosphatase MutT (NUDIX family)